MRYKTESTKAPAPTSAATVMPPTATREAPLFVEVAAAEADEVILLVTDVGTTMALVTVVLVGMSVAPVPDVVYVESEGQKLSWIVGITKKVHSQFQSRW